MSSPGSVNQDDARPQTKGSPRVKGSIWELLSLFLKMGLSAFGGPVAHIALMERDIIRKKRWMDEDEFVDLMGLTNLVPGPNSTEMVMHIGYAQHRRWGVVLAGAAFIFPAFLITAILSWLYVTYGSLPSGRAIFYGIQPVVLAIIAGALWRLVPKGVKDLKTGLLFAAALIASFAGVDEVIVILLAGIAGLIWFSSKFSSPVAGLMSIGAIPGLVSGVDVGTVNHTLVRLTLLFLKAGAVLYGSGYVLIAYIQEGLVDTYGWLTSGQLLDAIAIGQMTPGPVLTTATSVGFIVGGWKGAILATIAIFLPAFLIIMLMSRWIPWLRNLKSGRYFLTGVNAAVVAVMLAVTIRLGRDILVDLPTVVVAVLALLALERWKVDTLALVGLGAVFGLARQTLL